MRIDRPPFQPQPWASPLNPLKPPIVPIANPEPAAPSIEEFAQTLASKMGSKHLPKHTHFVFVLDASGSMLSIKSEIEALFRQQMQLVQQAAKDLSTGITTVSLIVFNHTISRIYTAASPEQAHALTPATYLPSGGTALLDAIGAAIELTGDLPAIEGKDTAVFITVLTDGEERDSCFISGPAAATALSYLQKTNALTFALVGTERTLSTLGNQLNVPQGLRRGFDPTRLDSVYETASAMAAATSSYSATRASGSLSTSNLF